MLNRFKLILILSVVLIILPISFAADNETVSDNGLADGNVFNNEYYFDASLDNDNGNGSYDNPYKYLTDSRIVDNSIIHLASGEYDLNP